MKAKPLPPTDKLHQLFIYDEQTGELRWRYSGDLAGSTHTSGYISVQIFGERYQSHRLIWAMQYGSIPENMMIDHIDGDRSNNRITNLRLANDSQNQFNRRANTGRSIKGVYPHKRKWKAEITANKQRVYLGLFDSPESAYEAYKAAAYQLHGEHANV